MMGARTIYVPMRKILGAMPTLKVGMVRREPINK
jgi:hypothetical protein